MQQDANHSIQKALTWLQIGAFILFLAVALGAFGAHGLEKTFSPKQLDVWNKAVTYMVMHGLAILVVAVLMQQFSMWLKSWQRVATSFLLGIVLFSGSLFLWALTQIKGLVFLTPAGGLLFLLGWLGLLFTARKISKNKANNSL